MSKVRISWTIPAPVILGFVGQALFFAFALGIWKAGMESDITLVQRELAARNTQLESRLATLEKSAASNIVLIERVKGVEVKIELIQSQTANIDTKLDKLIDRRR